MFGKVFAMFIGLKILSAFLGISRLPLLLSDFVVSLDVNPNLIIMAIVILYIILGCIMNIMPMMMLTLPTIFPVVVNLGFDPIWFGALCVVTMEMGQITPPVGVNVFTLSSLYPDISITTIFKGVIPFFLGMLLCVFLLWMFPQIALFLV
ncbi:MAG: TRAP transporter large permease subunit, partial [Mailhella sp.]|nr:TRAP transporter large permease subunit [Mailhella sp.]